MAMRIERVKGLLWRADLGNVPDRISQRLNIRVGRFSDLLDMLHDINASPLDRHANLAHATGPVILANRTGDHHAVRQQFSFVYCSIKGVIWRPGMTIYLFEFALLIRPDLVAAKIRPGEVALFIDIRHTLWQNLAVKLRIRPENIIAV